MAGVDEVGVEDAVGLDRVLAQEVQRLEGVGDGGATQRPPQREGQAGERAARPQPTRSGTRGAMVSVGRGGVRQPLRFPLRFRLFIVMIRTEDEMSINVWESQSLPRF